MWLLAPNALRITFKSLKPPFSTTIPVSPTDPISTIKGQIAAQPHAPPADAQRLLLKGKALADAKLLKEYSVRDGDTINLMVKPGVEWDPTSPPTPLLSVDPPPPLETPSASLGPGPGSPPPAPAGKKRGHSRIPSVVLSPTPSSPLERPMDIQLVDGDGFTLTPDVPTESAPPQTTYRTAVSRPEYWERLLAFLRFCRVFCATSFRF
jgi:UV excision repair protein RAD23